MDRWPSGWMAQWMDGSVDRWPSGCMAHWIGGSSGCMAQWMDRSVAGWPSGCMAQWMDVDVDGPVKIFRFDVICTNNYKTKMNDKEDEIGSETLAYKIISKENTIFGPCLCLCCKTYIFITSINIY